MKSYVYIDGWKSNIRFSSTHVIPEYKKCGRLHGHTYAVHIKITGDPDENGIIIDFSFLKGLTKEIVNELDHRILIPNNSKIVKFNKNSKIIEISSLGKKYIFPSEDCILLPISSTSAENLAYYILEKVLGKISSNKRIKNIEIGVDEGFGQGARVIKDIN